MSLQRDEFHRPHYSSKAIQTFRLPSVSRTLSTFYRRKVEEQRAQKLENYSQVSSSRQGAEGCEMFSFTLKQGSLLLLFFFPYFFLFHGTAFVIKEQTTFNLCQTQIRINLQPEREILVKEKKTNAMNRPDHTGQTFQIVLRVLSMSIKYVSYIL